MLNNLQRGDVTLASMLMRANWSAAVNAEFEIAVAAKNANDWRKHCDSIRNIYRMAEADIADGVYTPYMVNWPRIFTHIEEECWFTIRACGLRMFPQFPIGRFLADFADPWTKRVIECDGAEFHKDKGKDASRDGEMGEMGWNVIRIPGNRLILGEDDPRSGDAIIRELFGQPKRCAELEETAA